MNEDTLTPEREMQSLQELMQDVRMELHEIRRARRKRLPSINNILSVHEEEHEQLLSAFGRRVKILSERIAKRDLTYHAGREIRRPGAIAQLMTPLASEERVVILSMLSQQSQSFKELEHLTGKKGGALKHHLGQLEKAGYIQQHKNRGKYSITLDGELVYRLSVWFASCLVADEE